ncbi:hypothetical protein FZC33_23065 [Labrys sp. KNU-23]|uniref:COG4223 family protein n=1 Tax=Labrys sp. KNU-23 TaxID=2789216 RepID=UPI0011EE1818|nr:hypothetical protein [Labrys sp. KNU-23]QEN89005.1 hypothetical protein FZC33_23065 [Labrys sp. KNU-23]
MSATEVAESPATSTAPPTQAAGEEATAHNPESGAETQPAPAETPQTEETGAAAAADAGEAAGPSIWERPSADGEQASGDTPRTEAAAEPEAATPPPRAESEFAPPPQRSGLSTLAAALAGGIAGGVLVLLAGALGVVPLGKGGGDDGLSSRLAIAEQEAAAARKTTDEAISRLTALETGAKATQEAANNALALAGEAQKSASAAGSTSAVPSAGPDISGLTERLAKAEGEIATLGDGLRQVGTASNGLTEELAQVKQAASATPDKAAAYAVALGQLSEAIRSGKPFATELQTATGLGGNAEALAPLANLASTGVPSIEALATSYDALKPQIEAALTPKPEPLSSDAGVMDRITASLGNIVTVTREGEGGDGDPVAAAEKVSKALHKGDLSAAITAFKAMPEAGQQAGAAWLTQATGAAEALALIKAQTGAALQKFSHP